MQVRQKAHRKIRRQHSVSLPKKADLKSIPGARRQALPKQVELQLATLVKEPPSGDEWLHEQKFDGYRMLCRIAGGRAQFISRNQQDWTGRLKSLVPPVLKLPVRQALLDGEVVVLDKHGISSFQNLQNAFREGRTRALVYFVFDLLHLNEYDLTGATLIDRKEILKSLIDQLPQGANHIRFSDHLPGPAAKLRRKMCELGLEGMISKRRDSLYLPGRTMAWLKSKCRQEQELVIGGFTDPAGSRVGFGALLLGYFSTSGEFVYAGRVGTGFNERLLRDLLEQLKSLEHKQSPFASIPRSAATGRIHYVKPLLVAQIQFNNWTDDGLLRQAAFLGLREDKPARQVKRESPLGTRPVQPSMR